MLNYSFSTLAQRSAMIWKLLLSCFCTNFCEDDILFWMCTDAKVYNDALLGSFIQTDWFAQFSFSAEDTFHCNFLCAFQILTNLFFSAEHTTSRNAFPHFPVNREIMTTNLLLSVLRCTLVQACSLGLPTNTLATWREMTSCILIYVSALQRCTAHSSVCPQ